MVSGRSAPLVFPKLGFSINGTSRSQKRAKNLTFDFYSSFASLMRSSLIKTDFALSRETFEMPSKRESCGGQFWTFQRFRKKKKKWFTATITKGLCFPNLTEAPEPFSEIHPAYTLSASFWWGEERESWGDSKTETKVDCRSFCVVLGKNKPYFS